MVTNHQSPNLDNGYWLFEVKWPCPVQPTLRSYNTVAEAVGISDTWYNFQIWINPYIKSTTEKCWKDMFHNGGGGGGGVF